MEVEEKQALHRRLSWEKDYLLQKIIKAVSRFDKELDELRHEKFKAEGDLKVLDLKMLILHQELELLKEFEKEDVSLADKLQSKRSEKADLSAKIEEFEAKYHAKKSETEEVEKKIQEYDSLFADIVGDNNLFAEFLKKVYFKSVKRSKKQSPAKEDFNYNSDDEHGEDNYDYNDLEEEDEDVEEEVRPVDCEESLYNKVIHLREKRLVQEDVRNEIKKASEVIKKEIETLVKKEKIVANALLATENELQELQKNKQDKLNELDVVISLKLSQYQCLNAASLAECLVFTNGELEKLHKRIKSLQNELNEFQHNLKGLQKETVNLAKDKVAKKARNKQLEAKAVEVQTLKFGQVINLETLEKKSVNKPAEELKEKMLKDDKKRMKQLEHTDVDVKNVKEQYAIATLKNTELLNKLATLTDSQYDLESVLDLSQHTMISEYSGAQKKERMEERTLMETAQRQAKTIVALRAEIAALKNKGTPIYSE